MYWRWTRSFSSTGALRALPEGVPVAGHLRLPRSLVAISGPDSSKFLNGLLTIRPPDAPEGVSSGKYGAMLNSKGRVVFDTFVYPAHGSGIVAKALPGVDSRHCYLLEVDDELVERALRIFSFYKLQSNIAVNQAKGLGVWFAWNDDAETNDLLPMTLQEETSAIIPAAVDTRAPGLGVRVISEKNSPLENVGECVDYDTYRLRRYLFGVPEGSAEIRPDKSLPLEYCMDYMGGIDFHKGCYVGQELTIRTHHHGVVRKRLAPLVFTEQGEELSPDLYIPRDVPVHPGDEIFDKAPIPNAPVLGHSPFAPKADAFGFASNSAGGEEPTGQTSTRVSRPAGKVVAVLGNVGLGSLRIDKLGHEFAAGEISVTGLTPYWWPEEATN